MSTIICDGQIIDQNIEEFGTTITVYDVSTSASVDEYHELTETLDSGTEVKAIVQRIDETDERVREGIFLAGELFIYFKRKNHDLAKIGNQFDYAGERYRIASVFKKQQGSTVYVRHCRALILQR
jgi:hypothetical protein